MGARGGHQARGRTERRGPRATPTFHDGKVYALGGTAVLVRLDARKGELDWKVELKKDLDVPQAVFGFACSPLVHKGKVYVHPGVKGPILAAYDAESGKKLWAVGAQTNESYSSPQLATLAGVEQVLVFGSTGLTGHDPETGKQLWHYEWNPQATAQPSVQPTVLPGDRVVVGGAQPGTGFRCVKVTKTDGVWKAETNGEGAWETEEGSPRFNDVVYHEGYLYGLDGGRLFCLDAAKGKVVWKTAGSDFDSGQVLLVGKRLLVQAESGAVYWCDPNPAAEPKPEKVPAMNDKTWNHPAVVRGRLVVRNASEIVCFKAE